MKAMNLSLPPFSNLFSVFPLFVSFSLLPLFLDALIRWDSPHLWRVGLKPGNFNRIDSSPSFHLVYAHEYTHKPVYEIAYAVYL